MANALSEKVAAALLDKLSNDDDFRALFQKEPAAALHKVGYAPAAEKRGISGQDASMCCTMTAGMPSKAEFAEKRAQYLAQLTTKLPLGIFDLKRGS